MSRPNLAYKLGEANLNRIGQLADTGIWDNGLYTMSTIQGIEVKLLIDNGSSATLLSNRIYSNMDPEVRPPLQKINNTMQGANGQEITVCGQIKTQLYLGNSSFDVNAIVCDIVPDGIIGQDFLLRYASNIDYSKAVIYTDRTQINCWIGGEAQAKCRVLMSGDVSVPPMSMIKVPVVIENKTTLSSLVLLCASQSLLRRSIAVVEGVLQIDSDTPSICLINTGNESVMLPSNIPIGVCESYYETQTTCRSTSLSENNSMTKLPDYLKELYERSTAELNEDQSAKLEELLIKYKHVFAKSSDDLGRNNSVQHRINTGTATPIRQPPRRQPLGKRDTEKEEIQKMLDRGVIEPSTSSWSSPIVLVTKKDGSTRFCVDYRRLNDVTIKDAYPIPKVEECLDALSGSKWYCCMDLNSGFWQVALNPEDKHKSAFSTSLGLYQFTVMPFGLANSPSTFERLIENVLRGLQWEECLVYMDDIIVPAENFEQGLVRLEHVFQRLEQANLKLKPSKCVFFKKSVRFLGHLVSEEGVETDPDKINTVSNWTIPRNKKQLRSFLGLCSYYRRFVSGFAAIARPLHKLCEKAEKFQWSDEANNAFELLKTALTSTPILAYPQLGKTFILDTDASDFATGAVLSQEQEGEERVIAYMSKSLNAHERSYCVTRKELLAVIVALKKFHTYLYGQKVLLRTDNSAVSWMKNLKLPTGQMARWIQELGLYDITVVHRKGRKHSNADALSRAPCKVCRRYADDPVTIKEVEELDACDDSRANIPDVQIAVRVVTRSQDQIKHAPELLHGWDPETVRNEQKNDSVIGPVLDCKEKSPSRPKWREISSLSPPSKILFGQWDRLETHSGMLYRIWSDGKNDVTQLIVPTANRRQLLMLNHDIPTAAHLGWKATLKRIQTDFYWPGMKADVQKYCEHCDKCAARKPSRASNKAPLGRNLVGGPMEKVSMDILGPLITSERGNKYVLVMSDEFTKWVEAFAIPNQETSTIVNVFVDQFVCRFGVPLQVHTDQGRNFESALFKQMCDLFHIYKTHTTSFRPQANGHVERFNRTLLNMLSVFCNKNQRSWDTLLPQVMMAYRATEHSTSGFTPNMMVFGRNVILPSQAVVGRPERVREAETAPEAYVEELQDSLEKAHEIARQNLRRQAVYRKKYYDANAKERALHVGQPVWLHDPSIKPGLCKKLANRWNGPYKIEKKLDDLTYLVRTSPSKVPRAVHIDRLLPYKGEHLPLWMKKTQ